MRRSRRGNTYRPFLETRVERGYVAYRKEPRSDEALSARTRGAEGSWIGEPTCPPRHVGQDGGTGSLREQPCLQTPPEHKRYLPIQEREHVIENRPELAAASRLLPGVPRAPRRRSRRSNFGADDVVG